MNPRFIVLSTLSVLLRIGGILLLAAGIILLFWSDPDANQAPVQSIAISCAAVAAIVFGLVNAVLGEIVGVLFAIEQNTRDAAYYLRAIKSNTRRIPKRPPTIEKTLSFQSHKDSEI